ncbi:hypothetical protein B0J14DRAFT_608984 [Halenospora varia]|nr:hypothetical protein B0J14DRAFT_608984 [Halenospora varia]
MHAVMENNDVLGAFETPLMAYERASSPSSAFSESSNEEETRSSIHACKAYSFEEHLEILQSVRDGDFSNVKAILALPRRRNKSQRPLAMQLAIAAYPEMAELAALIRYEQVVLPAKSIVRQEEKARTAAQLAPKRNSGGKLLRIQGPWAGQDVDPLDLNGPKAIPMPVEIGSTKDFEPIFSFLADDRPFWNNNDDPTLEPNFRDLKHQQNKQGKRGLELVWHNPIVEFPRGIVYEDGRLDLCKKVVGPTHIGNLMKSLEPNHHIKHFLLGNNAISTTGAKEISDFIAKYPDRMETWYIAGCHITEHGLSLLVPQMVKSSTVTNLWFKRNPFGPGSAPLLAQLVLNTKNLRTLDLETTELGDQATAEFVVAITGKVSSLRNIYLNANGIGRKACAGLARYLADPHCQLESLFLSTNPIGDVGVELLAPGIAANKTLQRLSLTSCGLTSKGVTCLASALTAGGHALHTLDLSASQTTTVHEQRFNYIDDNCVKALKEFIKSTSLRYLDLGRTVFTLDGMEAIRSAVSNSELVFFNLNRLQIQGPAKALEEGTPILDVVPAVKTCSLTVRNQLVKNQQKYFPHIEKYDDFLNGEELRFLRNTSDVRKIDSMYRTQDKRLGFPMDKKWEEGDKTWKLIVDDAEKWQKELS